MKNYQVLYAANMPYSGIEEISAENDEAALEAAKKLIPSNLTPDPELGANTCKRIVYLEDEDGNTVDDDIVLDPFTLWHEGEHERAAIHIASRLLQVLEDCEPELYEVLDMMRYEGDLPVTTLDGEEIKRIFDYLHHVAVKMSKAIRAAREVWS